MRSCGEALGVSDPVVFDPDDLQDPIVRAARRGPFFPLQGMMIRDWDRESPRTRAGTQFGIRVYTLRGIRFARCVTQHSSEVYSPIDSFFVVSQSEYPRLYREAVRLKRASAPPGDPPILAPGLLDTLHRNTIGYLRRDNLRRIRELGGRPRRGILLSGPPGNGKTSACRWIWQLCHKHGYEFRLVSPDAYRAARSECDPEEAVRALFKVARRGVVFFDDMDSALRDRELNQGGDDQAVFLGAMDGIEVREGVAYVFTTNCPLEVIDPAFKRPGRIDLALEFEPPTADLRRQLIDRWHPEVRAAIDIDRAIAATAGMSFAEIDELKNLLILGHLDDGVWDWDRAMRQWKYNRHDLTGSRGRAIGFHCNGQVAH
ncbi:MAG TPA: ATP-binding protein [Gemmataceae bacterium]|nr:ATP-binding protein [Gemmataceae bacterium]